MANQNIIIFSPPLDIHFFKKEKNEKGFSDGSGNNSIPVLRRGFNLMA